MCGAAIDRHIHGVLTRLDWGGRSGGNIWDRSSQIFLECGSVVVTAVAAMGGRGRVTGWDGLIVSAPGASGILTSVSCERMMKHRNGACWVGGGASLMGVSVSPAVSALGAPAGSEGKFNLGPLYKDNASGAGGILTSVSRASMGKRTNGAGQVGGEASLVGVSISPAVSTLGGLVG